MLHGFERESFNICNILAFLPCRIKLQLLSRRLDFGLGEKKGGPFKGAAQRVVGGRQVVYCYGGEAVFQARLAGYPVGGN